MRLAVAAFTIALGYALVYYGIGLFRNYYPNGAVQSNQPDPTAVDFYSLGQLLGVTKTTETATAHVPFGATATTSSGGSASTSAPTTKPSGGVQLA
jgi:hypothetical protein